MKTSIIIAITLVLASGPLYGDAIEQPPPIPAEEQPEVLTRGPVHEAFAEPVDLQVQEGLVVSSEPPANIVENPPSDRPSGGQFIWVPGYWAWDSERNSYIWVSGCWRAAPQNMYWVPGYWFKVPEGWEWVPGFWTPVTDVQQIEYLPAPPALDEVQPPGLAPSPDNIWVPPCWYWYQSRYVLRHGYWLVARSNWVWAPSHYVWTPRGYVFIAGQWDYPLERRGVLFAPVYFPRHVYERPGFSFSASIVIDIGNVQLGLFTYPRYSHYYFGDYYDDVYIGIGIYPWFECVLRHTWYDPIYEYDRWHFRRTDTHWEEHERNEYDLRRANKDLRPPRTYHEMETRMDRLPEPQRRNIQIARPMTAVVADRANPMKFEQINNGARSKIATQSTDVRKFREERRRWESPAAEQKTVQPLTEHKGPVTLPTERKAPVTPPTERQSPVTPPTERKSPVTPPTERQSPVTPPTERKAPVTLPTERKSPVTPPTERQGPVTPPTERQGPVTPPTERKVPVTLPTERQGPVTPPIERKSPVTLPTERKGSVTPPNGHRDTVPASIEYNHTFIPPRKVNLTQAEKVTIPKPPIVGRQRGGIFVKGPPSRPVDEKKTENEDTNRGKNTRTDKNTRSDKDTRRGKG